VGGFEEEEFFEVEDAVRGDEGVPRVDFSPDAPPATPASAAPAPPSSEAGAPADRDGDGVADPPPPPG
jgi:hypothetical protein